MPCARARKLHAILNPTPRRGQVEMSTTNPPACTCCGSSSASTNDITTPAFATCDCCGELVTIIAQETVVCDHCSWFFPRDGETHVTPEDALVNCANAKHPVRRRMMFMAACDNCDNAGEVVSNAGGSGACCGRAAACPVQAPPRRQAACQVQAPPRRAKCKHLLDVASACARAGVRSSTQLSQDPSMTSRWALNGSASARSLHACAS
eukprot:CAMPEP_0114112136 /NCGR_PEP_ID=MMETSP0043_2-20121206/2227_1 /TAXON_ID=464988 /ORGANISM="Hemiselmis andersenii, Strain CCMP644" /LENGTH=207 /DNA_ID=CAMNT_0001204217 /DNA_START=286 /DNA_END=907 /DNA_ORIENTATION=+